MYTCWFTVMIKPVVTCRYLFLGKTQEVMQQKEDKLDFSVNSGRTKKRATPTKTSSTENPRKGLTVPPTLYD